MDETISAAEANRRFSRVLRAVRDGHSFVVTSHGKAVARLQPANRSTSTGRNARRALLARLRNEPAIDIGPWRREELYSRGQ